MAFCGQMHDGDDERGLSMDVMGRLYDALVLVVVMFIFPAVWAVSASENVAYTEVEKQADMIIERFEHDGSITADSITRLEDITKQIPGLRFNIIIYRDSFYITEDDAGEQSAYSYRHLITMDEIMDSLERKEEFMLLPPDTVYLYIMDEATVYYTAIRHAKIG